MSTSSSSSKSDAGLRPGDGDEEVLDRNALKPKSVSPPPAKDSGSKRKSSSRKRKHNKRQCTGDSHHALDVLTAQVNSIQQFLVQQFSSDQPMPEDNESTVSLDVSGELYNEEDGVTPEPHKDFTLPLNTVLKEPGVLNSNETFLDLLKSIQHFDSDSWSDVRYSDVQKRYCSTPGFTNLECNDELKPYDKYNNLSLTERGFAAITQGLLKQHVAVENGFKSLLAWFKSSDIVEIDTIESKIKEFFSDGDFQKISNDLLQMTCGHRANLIQQHRDAILRSVKDKFVKSTLRKIPPSCQNLFNVQTFSSVLEKQGGINKAFWPAKSDTNIKKASSSTNLKPRIPAQGMPRFAVPFRNQIMPPAHGVPMPYCAISPLQETYHFMPNYNRMPVQSMPFHTRALRPQQGASYSNTKSGSSCKGQAKRKY